MKSFRISCILFLYSALSFYCLGESGSQFTDLFNGKNLDGWEGSHEYWRVSEGAIVGEIKEGERLEKNHWLIWKDGDVRDFELRLQFRLSGNPRANSGIQFRCQAEGINSVSGYQADLDMGTTWLGRIYDEHGRKILVERGDRVLLNEEGDRIVNTFVDKEKFPVLFREDDWNDYRIIACDEYISVEVNGTLFSQLIDREIGERDLVGQLAFQLHGGLHTKVEFRDIQLRTLRPGEHRFVVEQATSEKKTPTPGIIPVDADGDPLNLGFEDGTLKDWMAEGNAFDGQPVKNDSISERWPGQTSGKNGSYFISGYDPDNNGRSGTLTSASFKVTHRWASFLIGGGSGQACRVEVVLDNPTNKIIEAFRGKKKEQMDRIFFDLGDYLGEQIFIRLVDNSTRAWTHVNYDDFRFHSERPHELEDVAVAKIHENPILAHLVRNPNTSDYQGSETVETMSVVEGFRVDLVASEPDLHQPIAFTFDAKGRIWVIEAHSYPTKRREGEGLDKIVIFEDADGNGSYETRTLFIEGLNLASGIEVGFGGVWVGAAPELLFIPDRNGDDKPDSEPVVLLDGFGYQDTHETLNSFIWGPDGWLYGNQGIFNTANIGKPGVSDDERVSLTAGVWRYHPTKHEFEIFAHGGSNPWGLDFNDMGQLFMTHCRSRWGGGPTTHVVQGGHFWNQSNKGHADFVSGTAPDNFDYFRNFLMASARYGHGEGGAGKPGSRSVYGGHSLVGCMLYLGDNWPEKYRNHLFTHNLHGHQMNHQINIPEGSGYNTRHAGKDFLYVPEPTFVGVDLKYGPDGSVIFSDWVDLQHCHNPKSEQWDRGNGRLYRMAWEDTYVPVKVDLKNASDMDLVNYQLHPNEWFVRVARRVLQERAARGVLSIHVRESLFALARNHEEASRRLRALWTLHAIGGLDDSLADKILDDQNPYVRGWVIQLMTEEKSASSKLENRFLQLAKSDPSPVVRLYLASAIQRVTHSARWKLIEVLASHKEDEADRLLPKMIWFGLAELLKSDPERGFALARKSPLKILEEYAHWYGAKLQGEGLNHSLKSLELAKDKIPVLEAIALGLEGQRNLQMPERWTKISSKLYESNHTRIAELARDIGATFGDESVYSEMRDLLIDKRAKVSERQDAFSILAEVNDPVTNQLLISLLDDPAFTTKVIDLTPKLRGTGMASKMIQRFDQYSEEQKMATINALTKNEDDAVALLDAIANKKIDRDYLTAFHARELSIHNNIKIDEKLEKVWGRVKETPEEVQKKIQKLDTFYNQAPLWAFKTSAGKSHFNALCSACHQPNETNTGLGPDLMGAGGNGVRYFLENIMDPNAVVGSDYELTIIETKTGQVVSGMIERETDSAITLRTLSNTITLARDDIAKISKVAQSMMPPGLMETLNETEQVELLKYLSTLQGSKVVCCLVVELTLV